MPIDSARLAALAERAEEYLATKYHIPVHIRDVPKPFLGDLDGSQIDIDDDTEPSERLFLTRMGWSFRRGRAQGAGRR